MATAAVTVLAAVAGAAHAGTPIDTNQPFYNQSDVGTTVNPDFQGGTLRNNVNAVTDTHAYNVENFPTNTLDEFGNTVTFTGTFSGSGPLTITDSVGGGNAVFTGTSVLGGAVTINSGATMSWGNGTGGAFLIGPANAVVDNGSLVMNFGGASGVVGEIPISGTGSVTIHTGIFEQLGASTYTGTTTVDSLGTLRLGNSGGGSVGTLAGNLVDNGLVQFEYGAAGPVVAPGNISGSGSAEVVSGTVVAASGLNVIGGAVTIDSGATLQWGNGGTGAFGGIGGIIDNGTFAANLGAGNISSSIAVSGTGDVHVLSGTLGFSGVNTYTGVTTIDQGGVLALTGGGSVSNSSNITVNGTFDISGSSGTSITTLDGSGGVSLGAQILTLTNASGTFAGNLADGGAFGGTGGGLTIAGGTETLTGTNTYTGVTTINGGATLVLGAGGTTGTVAGGITDNGLLQFNYGGPVTINNSIGGSGSAEVVAGTLVVGSGLNVIGGTVTVDNGATLQWGNGGVGAFGGIGGIVDNGTFAADLGAGNVSSSIAVSGTGDLHVLSGTLGLSAANTYTGVTTIDQGGLLELTGGGSVSASSNVVVNGTLDISGEPAGTSITTLSGAGGVSLGALTLTLTNASGVFGGNLADGGAFGGTGGGLTIAGGTETLTGTNTYTGTTTINSGATLVLGAGGSTGTVAGDISDKGLLQFNYGGPVTINNNIGGAGSAEVVAGTLVIGSGLNVIGGTVTIDNGATLQWGNGGVGAFGGVGGIVDNGTFAANLGAGNVSSSIAVSGTGDVHVLSGTLGFSGVNTYTGVTTIDGGGLLELTGGGSISNSSNVAVNGTLDISGSSGTSIITLDGTGGVSLGAQTLTLTNASGTFAGNLADGGMFGGTGGGLTIAGGTETLTGTNTYTGNTTIDLGATLQLGNGGSTGTVAGAVVDNGLLQFNYTGSVNAPGTIGGSGSAEVVSGTLVAASGLNVIGGTVTIDGGATLQWGNGGVGAFGGVGGIVDNGAFAANLGAGNVSSSIAVSGTGAVHVLSGTLGFSGVNTYTGVTTIDGGGLLELTGGGSISNSSNVTVNGTLDISGEPAGTSITTLSGAGGVSLGALTLTLTNASGTFGGVLADGGAFGGTGGGLTIGGGTETLTGVNTFTGLTTVDVGATLDLVGDGSIAKSDPLVNGTFDISGASGGVDITSLSGHGHVILGANTLTLTAAGDLFSGVISGNGGLTIAAGIEGLSGVNTFTGTTLIDPGATLQLGDGAGTMGLLTGPIADNGHLVFNGGAASDAIFATGITGTGDMTLVSGTLGLTGTNTYAGPTTIDLGATLQLGEGGSTGSVTGTVFDNGLVQFRYGGGPVIASNTFTGTGAAEVVSGTVVITGASAINGNVTIDSGATMQWGNAGPTPGFLIGGTGVIDNGHLVMDFGGGGVGTSSVISGLGDVTLQSGSFNTAAVNTYTGPTTIDGGALFLLSAGGSIATSSNVIDNGFFDISGVTTATSITTLSGTGDVALGSKTLTLTNASGTFGGVLGDGGISGGTGGGLTIAAGTETLTGTNIYTGPTTINGGATLVLGDGGATGSVAGNVIDNGLVQFKYGGGPVIAANSFSGTGAAEAVSGTVVITGASAINGNVTIDSGATMQWGDAGPTPGFLIGGTGVIDNGHLVMDFGGGGVGTTAVISGSGDVTLQSGSYNTAAVNTYTGPTTIDGGALFLLSAGGSIAPSSTVIDNGTFDISGVTAGTSITSLSGAGGVSLGSKTLVITDASGTFGGVLADGGVSGGTGGGLMIAGGTQTLTGTNTYTGLTAISTGATLQLGDGGATGSVAGPILDNGALRFVYGGSVTLANAVGGTGSAELESGTLVVTGAGLVGGTVTIDNGATMQWGNGGVGFLIGGSGVIDNGALVMNFGSNGLAVGAPISGVGSVTVQSGAFISSAVNTYTGVTTIDSGAAFRLSGTGSIANSSNVIDNGQFDIFDTTAGASIKTLSGGGGGFLGAQTLTLTDASGTFSGGLSDGGLGGTGGGLTIAGGTEILTGANTFSGLTTIDAGAGLQLGAGGTTGSVAGNILDNGTLVFDRSNFLFVDGAISGNGAIDQIGSGTTVLDAVNPFSGLTTVSGGTLVVGDASHTGAVLGGDVLVDPGGRLEGHGTIGGSVTNNGVVAPGGTIGTLTVGSFTQGPGGTLGIEVSPAAASQLNVVGAASLNGKLALSFDPGVYTNHIYDILNGHPVTGTFASITAAGSPGPGMTFGVFYAPTQVDLVTEATGSAQIYGGVSAATIDRTQNFATLVEDRFGDAGCADGSRDKAGGCGGYGAWAFAIGSSYRQDAEGGAFGFRNTGAGVVAGIDRSSESGSLVGASFGYAHNDLDMGQAASKASGPSYFGAIYGRLVDGGLWVDGQLFYMHSDWAVSRAMTGLGVATASPNTDSEGFLLQASLPIGNTGLRPYARFTYVLSNRGGVLENGVGPLGFQINSAEHSAAVGEIGLRYEALFGAAGGVQVRPILQLGVQGNFSDRDQVVTGSLDGLPGSAFAQQAPRFWHVAAVADGAVKVRVNQSLELFGDLQGRFTGNQTDAVASVGGVIRF